MPSHALLSIALVAGVALAAGTLAAAELPKLTPLPPLQLDLSAPGTVIVSPESAEYQPIAARLAGSLADATRRKPRVLPDATLPADLGAGPVVVLGNLMDSRLARSLYVQAYDFTDASWPSAGGHVLRTIRDPLGTGAHVFLVGGSDPAGVADAAAALVALVKERGPILGYVNQVKLGQWAAEIEGYTREILGGEEKVWQRSGVSGSWDFQIQIARAAIGYLRTGNEAYLPLFKRELRYWFDHDVYHPKGDAPQMLHGFLNTLLIPWDLVRDHPAFTEEERRAFDADFLWVFSSPEGPVRIEPASRNRVIRDNHGTRTGLDAFFGGRYFARRFGLPQGEAWLDLARRYFDVQMHSAKPVEDSWGHQWAASLYNTLVYALAAGVSDYPAAPAAGATSAGGAGAVPTGGGGGGAPGGGRRRGARCGWHSTRRRGRRACNRHCRHGTRRCGWCACNRDCRRGGCRSGRHSTGRSGRCGGNRNCRRAHRSSRHGTRQSGRRNISRRGRRNISRRGRRGTCRRGRRGGCRSGWRNVSRSGRHGPGGSVPAGGGPGADRPRQPRRAPGLPQRLRPGLGRHRLSERLGRPGGARPALREDGRQRR